MWLSIACSPNADHEFQDKEKAIRELIPAFKSEPGILKRKIGRKKYFVWLARITGGYR